MKLTLKEILEMYGSPGISLHKSLRDQARKGGYMNNKERSRFYRGMAAAYALASEFTRKIGEDLHLADKYNLRAWAYVRQAKMLKI